MSAPRVMLEKTILSRAKFVNYVSAIKNFILCRNALLQI